MHILCIFYLYLLYISGILWYILWILYGYLIFILSIFVVYLWYLCVFFAVNYAYLIVNHVSWALEVNAMFA